MSDQLNETLQDLRVNYQQAKLDISDCSENPTEQFDKWVKEAVTTKCDEPNAFVLSTSHLNKPRARVVLLKGIVQNELLFYTNYDSHKANEISCNQHVSMTFLWLPLQRQLRVEGRVHKVSEEMSENYFKKRPRGSQLGAIASPKAKK